MLGKVTSVVGVMRLVGVSMTGTARSASGMQPSAATVEARLREVAAEVAVENRDAHPGLAEYVLTTRRRAVNLDDTNTVDSDGSVFLVVMRGKFMDSKSFAPAGAQDPTGNQIEITVDAKSGAILDFGLLTRSAGLGFRKLGVVHTITASVVQAASAIHL